MATVSTPLRESVVGAFANVAATLPSPQQRRTRNIHHEREYKQSNNNINFTRHHQVIKEKVDKIPHQLSNMVHKVKTSIQHHKHLSSRGAAIDDEEFINNVTIRDNADFVQLVFPEDGPLGIEIFRHSSNGVLVVKGVKPEGQAEELCLETLLKPEIFKGAVILAINHVTYDVKEGGISLWDELIHPDRPKSILFALNRAASPHSTSSVRRSIGINKIYGYNLVELVMTEERSQLGIRFHSERTDECKVELFNRKQEAYQRAMECLLDPAIFMDASIIAVNGRKYTTRENMFNALQSNDRPMHILFELAQSPARCKTSILKKVTSSIRPPTEIIPTPARSERILDTSFDESTVSVQQEGEEEKKGGEEHNINNQDQDEQQDEDQTRTTTLREWNTPINEQQTKKKRVSTKVVSPILGAFPSPWQNEEQRLQQQPPPYQDLSNLERVMVTTATTTTFIYKPKAQSSPEKPHGSKGPHNDLSASNATAATEFTSITIENDSKVLLVNDDDNNQQEDSRLEKDEHNSDNCVDAPSENGVSYSIGEADRWETSSFDNDEEIRLSFQTQSNLNSDHPTNTMVSSGDTTSLDDGDGNIELFFSSSGSPQEQRQKSLSPRRNRSAPQTHYHHQVLAPEEEEFRLSFFREQKRKEQQAQEEQVVFDETYMMVPSSSQPEQQSHKDEFGEYFISLVEEGCATSSEDDELRQHAIQKRRLRLQRQRRAGGGGVRGGATVPFSNVYLKFSHSKYNTKKCKIILTVVAVIVAASIVLSIIAVKNRWSSGIKYS